MHGYGYPPEQPPRRRPSSATLISLRVLFVLLTVLSCGLLSWGAMLRLAIVTRRSRDWALLGVAFVLNVGLFVFIVSTPDDPAKRTDAQALIGMGWLIAVVAGVTAYYLYTDIRHFGRLPAPSAHARPQYGGGLPPQGTAVPPAPRYGYPPAAPPAPVPRPPISPSPPPQPPLTQPAVPAPTPPPATPHRLDQVRAELDELSDYLRKEGGSR